MTGFSIGIWRAPAGSTRDTGLEECCATPRASATTWMRAPRGVLVATIHLGDYLEGLRQLRLALSAPKRVLVMRRRAWSEIEAARICANRIVRSRVDGRAHRRRRGHIGGARIATRRHRGGVVRPAAAVRPHRRGRLLRPARTVRARSGRIAVLGHADVLPLFTHYDADGVSVTEAQPVIAASAVRVRRNARRAIATIAQRLVRAGGAADPRASEPMVALDVRARAAGRRRVITATSER